mmetsp:Transcript_53371/g.73974  ORF Transcript_53371/g.73974 Transcript_53371/m.73974 type:complete len:220 (-) Transcript_53371:196-855(-)
MPHFQLELSALQPWRLRPVTQSNVLNLQFALGQVGQNGPLAADNAWASRKGSAASSHQERTVLVAHQTPRSVICLVLHATAMLVTGPCGLNALNLVEGVPEHVHVHLLVPVTPVSDALQPCNPQTATQTLVLGRLTAKLENGHSGACVPEGVVAESKSGAEQLHDQLKMEVMLALTPVTCKLVMSKIAVTTPARLVLGVIGLLALRHAMVEQRLVQGRF